MHGVQVSDALALVAVLVGAALQRTTGLGFALVSAPFLVLLLGAHQGVLVANALSLVVSLVVLTHTWRGADLGRAVRIGAGILVAVPFGLLVVRELPSAWLLVVIGSATAVGVAVVSFGRPFTALHRPAGASVTGFVSGLFNLTAGVGGPPLSLYAVSTGWTAATFLPTMQVVSVVNNGASLGTKGLPQVPPVLLVGTIVTVLLGVAGGHLVASRIPAGLAMRLVLALAGAGSLLSVLKGVLAIAGA